MKYIIQSVEEKVNHAGPKAKADIRDVFVNSGYQQKTFVFPSDKLGKIMHLTKIIQRTLSGISTNDTVVLQFPTGFQTKGVFDQYLVNRLRKIDNKVVIVHDLEGLRQGDLSKLKTEINFLNQFKLVVMHNNKMTQICRKNGLIPNVMEINIFDYLVTNEVHGLSEINQRKVNFAGNLDKSEFISKIDLLQLKNAELNLFGPLTKADFGQGVVYHGSIASDEIPSVLNKNGGFGLIWDGNSLDGCEGKNGNYLKYNNPHKLSLYIASKIPVICWKKAAVANFISENNIGVLVDSLHELDEKVSNLTAEEYEIMKINIGSISEKVKGGFYTRKIIKEIEK